MPIKDIVESVGALSNGLQKGFMVWYVSPFRDEKKPSFRIDLRTNRWKDFGKIGKNKGTVIDFIVELKSCSIRQALAILESGINLIDIGSNDFSSFQEQKIRAPKKVIDKLGENVKHESVKITDIIDITHHALLEYLSDRCIPQDIACEFVREIHYINPGQEKEYFALGFKNDSGEYELRNKYIQGVSGKKDVTFLKTGPERTEVALYEGFFDFLSYASDCGKKSLRGAVIVLNSVNLLNRTLEILKNGEFNRILLFFDNDKAGDLATMAILEKFPRAAVDMRHLYAGFKDYNDFWMNKKSRHNE